MQAKKNRYNIKNIKYEIKQLENDLENENTYYIKI